MDDTPRRKSEKVAYLKKLCESFEGRKELYLKLYPQIDSIGSDGMGLMLQEKSFRTPQNSREDLISSKRPELWHLSSTSILSTKITLGDKVYDIPGVLITIFDPKKLRPPLRTLPIPRSQSLKCSTCCSLYSRVSLGRKKKKAGYSRHSSH